MTGVINICDKITVIKIFMLITLSHIATVLITPHKLYFKKFEKIMTDFMKEENKSKEIHEAVKGRASIVSQDQTTV